MNNLYSGVPANLGWPVFEGTVRMRKDPIIFNDLIAPIFEYKSSARSCVTGGVYLDDIESLLVGDFYGTIRLLKQQENGEWFLLYETKIDIITEGFDSDVEFENTIWGFGLDKKTKKIYVAPDNKEIEILVDKVKFNK